eukprot:s1352_g6.t1
MGGQFTHQFQSAVAKVFLNFGQELHDDLARNGNQLQAKFRDGKNNSWVANNFSGNTFPDLEDHSKYNVPWLHGMIDLHKQNKQWGIGEGMRWHCCLSEDRSEPDFCSAASRFLQIGKDVLQKASDKCRQFGSMRGEFSDGEALGMTDALAVAQAEDLERHVDKFVAIDVLCRKAFVGTDRAPETNADSGISEIQSDDVDAEEKASCPALEQSPQR